MVDMASVSAALTSLKVATDIAKFFKDTNVSFEKAETKLKLAELIEALADAKIQFADIQQLLLDKDAELRAVREQLSIKANLKWDPPYYWIVTDDKKDGPYCQCCYDKDRALIRLQGNGKGYWKCEACNNSYYDSSYVSKPTRLIRS